MDSSVSPGRFTQRPPTLREQTGQRAALCRGPTWEATVVASPRAGPSSGVQNLAQLRIFSLIVNIPVCPGRGNSPRFRKEWRWLWCAPHWYMLLAWRGTPVCGKILPYFHSLSNLQASGAFEINKYWIHPFRHSNRTKGISETKREEYFFPPECPHFLMGKQRLMVFLEQNHIALLANKEKVLSIIPFSN